MNNNLKIKGWILAVYSLFLGPLFLVLYFHQNRESYPPVKYFTWISFLGLLISSYLMFSFTLSPYVVRFIYCVFFLCILGLALAYCWVHDSKTKKAEPHPEKKYSFPRAAAWLIVMGVLFQGLNNIVQTIYFWIFGEKVAVYFSAEANTFVFWVFIGLIYGFFYGVRLSNVYFDKNLKAVFKSLCLIFLFIFMFNGLILLLIIYPLQRLAPISYSPQPADVIFYYLLFSGITFSVIYLIRTANRYGLIKMCSLLIAGIPLIALHSIVVSTYSTTINLTIASILEDRGEISSAEALYKKNIPYIRYDRLLASLHHRQGVLHVLNQDYTSAIACFKKVLTGYSEYYGVYENARRYVESFEKKEADKELQRTILPVKHRTFEQAASCYPNSLSVILKFYEEQPISTRKLSYSIKESFSSGTFIWKAESFLQENGYTLITTFWQDKNILISLIDKGFPVLIYVPGHVYTLYGYDANMEMFLTYDTAKSNRWNDKPFWNLQQDWMDGSFMMSVVVRQGEEDNFKSLFPQINRYQQSYSLWQKVQISNYYEQKENYWSDYNLYDLSRSIGLDRLKIKDNYYLSDDLNHLPWDQELWENEVLPVLSQRWAIDWPVMEKHLYYLIYSGKPEQALDLIQQYQLRISETALYSFPRLLEIKLAAAIEANRDQEVQSISDKLIGMTENREYYSYWGHYFKARGMIASGDLKAAVEILIPVLKTIYLDSRTRQLSLKYIFNATDEIYQNDPSLFDMENRKFMEVARIYFASDIVHSI